MAPKLKAELLCGKDCTLSKGCKHPHMKMTGNINAQILIVGQSPGIDEDDLGTQFVGRSGKLLRKALADNNITDFAVTNAVRCRPIGSDKKDRDPTTMEIKVCNPFLINDIASMPNLRLIVLLGNIAMQACLKMKGITSYNGKTIEKDGRLYFCVLHPAYVLRSQDELGNFLDAIGRIPNAIDGSLTNTNDYGIYHTIETIAQWKCLLDKIRRKREFVYDIETNGSSPYVPEAMIRCIGFSIEPREAWTLPIGVEANWTNDEWTSIYSDLDIIFGSKRLGKIGHNVKFDNVWMEQLLGIKVNNTIWDTKYSSYLLDENKSSELKNMAWSYTKMGGYEEPVGDAPHLASTDVLYPYNGMDCDVTNRILQAHRPILMKDKDLHFLFNNLMLPVSDVLAKMEQRGIRIDPDKLDECEKNVDAMLQSLDAKMKMEASVRDYERATETIFNPQSHTQLREVLFKYEGLTSKKLTAKARNPSTDLEVLEELSDQSHLCELLLDRSTYGSMKNKMIKELREYTTQLSRIHTGYLLAKAKTGRTSSHHPNMQNVTKGEKDVVGIRNVFIADPDCILAEFDYNQHELRCMAEEAEDEALAKAVTSGDVHRATASSILGIDPQLVTPDQRRNIGKTFNFGIIYGLTVWGIMRRLKCDKLQAQMYLDKFFGTYFKTKQWMDKTADFISQNGYVRSRTGRYRRLPIWDQMDEKQAREGINMPIQSLASDILLYALIGLDKFLADRKSYLCLEIHDSIILNIHKDEMSIIPEIKHIMLNYWRTYIPFRLPLEVDIKMGSNWGEMKEE